MSKRNKKKRNKKSKRTYTLGITGDKLSSRGGLSALLQILEALKIGQQADALFAVPCSNHSHRNSTLVNAFVLIQNEGATCLEDVYHLHTEQELLKLGGIEQLPGADTLARWLHRHGEAGVFLAHQISRTVIAETLKLLRVKRITLDIDATAILTNKSGAQWTYLKHRGFMPTIGTVAESGQVIAVEFRDGNVPPNYDNAGFIKACQAQLPKGIELGCVRADAARYQRQLIEGLTHQNIEFVIRARMDRAIKEAIAAVSPADWQPLRLRDGSLSQHEWMARRSHIMHHSDTAFDIVIQRTQKSEVSDLAEQRELLGLSIPTHFETDQYIYRVIATNIKSLDTSKIVHHYNQRGEYSENPVNPK